MSDTKATQKGAVSPDQHLRLHLSGSPSVDGIRDTTHALQELIRALGGGITDTHARLICDDCGKESRPLDMARLPEEIVSLVGGRWKRYPDSGEDKCPDCAHRQEQA